MGSLTTFYIMPVDRVYAVQYTGLLIDIEDFLKKVLPYRRFLVERENEEVVRVWDDEQKVWSRLALDWWLVINHGSETLYTYDDLSFARRYLAVQEVGAHTTNEHGQLVL